MSDNTYQCPFFLEQKIVTTYDNDPDQKEKVEDEKDEDRNLLKRFLLNTKNLSKPLCYQYDVGLSVLHKGTALYRGLFCLIFLIDELSHHPDHFVERWQAWTENFILIFYTYKSIVTYPNQTSKNVCI